MTDLLPLLADPPAPMLGIVIGVDKTKPVVRMKFHHGNLDECARWLRQCFCKWSGRMENQCVVTSDAAEMTVEVKGK